MSEWQSSTLVHLATAASKMQARAAGVVAAANRCTREEPKPEPKSAQTVLDWIVGFILSR